MLLERKKNSKVSEFSVLSYNQNRKLEHLKKCSLTSNFDGSCNLIFRNEKNEMIQKLEAYRMDEEERKKTSEVSDLSILPYNQNRKI